MKILYIDVETTGLNPAIHGIVQLAQIIEIDGDIVASGEWKLLPFEKDEIHFDAIRTHKIGKIVHEVNVNNVAGGGTQEGKYVPHVDQREPRSCYNEIISQWEEHVSRFDRDDKFIVAGYNISAFDLHFLRAFINKCEPNSKYNIAGCFLGHRYLDPLPLLNWLLIDGYLKPFENSLPNLKLSTVCGAFGIPLEAHDAMSDITATRELVKALSKVLKDD